MPVYHNGSKINDIRINNNVIDSVYYNGNIVYSSWKDIFIDTPGEHSVRLSPGEYDIWVRAGGGAGGQNYGGAGGAGGYGKMYYNRLLICPEWGTCTCRVIVGAGGLAGPAGNGGRAGTGGGRGVWGTDGGANVWGGGGGHASAFILNRLAYIAQGGGGGGSGGQDSLGGGRYNAGSGSGAGGGSYYAEVLSDNVLTETSRPGKNGRGGGANNDGNNIRAGFDGYGGSFTGVYGGRGGAGYRGGGANGGVGYGASGGTGGCGKSNDGSGWKRAGGGGGGGAGGCDDAGGGAGGNGGAFTKATAATNHHTNPTDTTEVNNSIGVQGNYGIGGGINANGVGGFVLIKRLKKPSQIIDCGLISETVDDIMDLGLATEGVTQTKDMGAI